MNPNNSEVNPLGTMISEMGKHGANVELKKRMPDGTYQTATRETMDALGAQARIASTAEAIQGMTKAEKTEWAINMKDQANKLYADKNYAEAVGIYMQALTATDFGVGEDKADGNVDEVVVPVLCNLAACCIQLKEWGKVLRFCEQCLNLRPDCVKAITRRGIAYVHVGEFNKALKDLNRSLTMVDNEAEKGRIKIYIGKAEKGLQEQEKSLQRRKKAMQSAFAPQPQETFAGKSKSSGMNFRNVNLYYALAVVLVAVAVYVFTVKY